MRIFKTQEAKIMSFVAPKFIQAVIVCRKKNERCKVYMSARGWSRSPARVSLACAFPSVMHSSNSDAYSFYLKLSSRTGSHPKIISRRSLQRLNARCNAEAARFSENETSVAWCTHSAQTCINSAICRAREYMVRRAYIKELNEFFYRYERPIEYFI
uniref:Uncharacterized protein n=1 Tax=Trichogramma kaykai TaxID=54128 RepID=A0ABD2X5I8_9HYME